MQTIEAPKQPRPRKKRPSIDLGKLVSTRRGTAVVAGVTALLAAAVLMVFLNQYRSSLDDADRPVTVLVAKSLIEKGSSGTVIAEKSIFQSSRVRKRDLKDGAVADPANLRGKVAADDIYPGQQLVITDFVAATGGVRDRITGSERAISLPLDNAHGMIGDIQAGDHVDVLVAMAMGNGAVLQRRPVVMTLVRDLLVLRAPKAPKTSGIAGTNTQEVVLRATDSQAAKLSYASEAGRIRLVLRPKVGATESKPGVVDERAIVRGAVPAARERERSR